MRHFFSTPEKTLKYEIRPANASDIVLKTYTEAGSLSVPLRTAGSPLLPAGCPVDGMVFARRWGVVDDEIHQLVDADITEAGG